jgi:hypothetical protein
MTICSDCPPQDYPTDKTRCEECPRLKAALKEISAWCADVLNADKGEVGYELREFASDVYGRIDETRHPIMNVLQTNHET